MNVDKAKKRIAKRVSRGERGYPKVTIEYFGITSECADEVVITYYADEDAPAQEQSFKSDKELRDDEAIQSVLLKIIERAEPNTVTQNSGVSVR